MKTIWKTKSAIITLLCLATVTFMTSMSGCGVEPDSPYLNGSPLARVKGVAATGNPIDGTVTLMDSSAGIMTTQTDAGGTFSFNVALLPPPFMLMVQWTENGATNRLYSLADGPGTANINPFSNAVFAMAAHVPDPSLLADNQDSAAIRSLEGKRTMETNKLQDKLSELFALYGTSNDPIDDDYEADHTGLDAMFDDVAISVSDGVITVTDKETEGVIFSAPVDDVDSGSFDENHMPARRGQVDGAALYADFCSSCHGPLEGSTVRGESASDIREAIREEGAMKSLRKLRAVQIQAVAEALSGLPTAPPDPSSCVYTYTAWSTCQSDGTQTRSMVSSTPDGCTGTPVLSQSCTADSPTTTLDGAALYTTYCSSCHGSLATSSKTGSSASKIESAVSRVGAMSGLSTLTTAEIEAIAAALGGTSTPSACIYSYSGWGACQTDNTQTRTVTSTSPSGCTGTPVLSQSCTYTPPACTYTYSGWDACQSDNTQTRTVTSTSPSGCSGTPVLSQSCTYTPPACTYTYSGWSACQSNNTQTRTVASTSPSGCSGTPVLSQSCTYTPPACTYTYSGWSACQSNNTQTRTVTSTSPSGCSGTPVLSQTCAYVAPIDGAALYQQYCSGCHGNSKKGTSAATIQNAINTRSAMKSLSFLTPEQIQAISTAP